MTTEAKNKSRKRAGAPDDNEMSPISTMHSDEQIGILYTMITNFAVEHGGMSESDESRIINSLDRHLEKRDTMYLIETILRVWVPEVGDNMHLRVTSGDWKKDREYILDGWTKEEKEYDRRLFEEKRKNPHKTGLFKCDSMTKGVVLKEDDESILILVWTFGDDEPNTFDLYSCPATESDSDSIVWNGRIFSISVNDIHVTEGVREDATDQAWEKFYTKARSIVPSTLLAH